MHISMQRLGWLLAPTLWLLLWGVSPAGAEQRSVDLARESYVHGLDAAQNERWSDAVEYFRHSYELSHTGAALYNLGVALRALGRHREARDTFSALLASDDDVDAATRANAETLRRDATERVVPVRIAGFEESGAYEVVLDGVPTAVSGRQEIALEVDPGKHALSVQRGSHTVLRWAGAVQAGAPVTLELEVAAVAPTPVAAAALPALPREREREPTSERGHRRRWWWTAAGGAAVVAAVLVGVLVRGRRAADPRALEVDAGIRVVELP